MEFIKTYWLFLASLATFIIVMSFVDKTNTRNRNRARGQIKGGILSEDFSYADLRVISERWWQKEMDTTFTLKLMLADAVSTEDKELSNHKDLLRSLKKEHEINQLFSELPENVRLKLRELQSSSSEGEEVIHHLASSLSTLYSKNQRAKKRDRVITLTGVFIGVAGLLLSILK